MHSVFCMIEIFIVQNRKIVQNEDNENKALGEETTMKKEIPRFNLTVETFMHNFANQELWQFLLDKLYTFFQS